MQVLPRHLDELITVTSHYEIRGYIMDYAYGHFVCSTVGLVCKDKKVWPCNQSLDSLGCEMHGFLAEMYVRKQKINLGIEYIESGYDYNVNFKRGIIGGRLVTYYSHGYVASPGPQDGRYFLSSSTYTERAHSMLRVMYTPNFIDIGY